MRSWLPGAALLLAAMACAPKPPPASTAPPPATTVDVEVDPLEVQRAAAPPPASMGPSEPGFIFCCGDGRVKLEIDCADMLKRCYEKQGDRWAVTYGRHCKTALGEACYLEQCDSRCR